MDFIVIQATRPSISGSRLHPRRGQKVLMVAGNTGPSDCLIRFIKQVNIYAQSHRIGRPGRAPHTYLDAPLAQ